MVMIVLPLPPSANRLHSVSHHGHGRTGRRRSREYDEWIAHAEALALEQSAHLAAGRIFGSPPQGRWSISIEANIGRRRDLDNIVKPTADFAARLALAPDDRWLDRISVRRSDKPVSGEMIVRISRIEEDGK